MLARRARRRLVTPDRGVFVLATLSADLSMMEALALLRLQMEWGADEALDDQPHDRLAAVRTDAAPPIKAVQPSPQVDPAPAPAPAMAPSRDDPAPSSRDDPSSRQPLRGQARQAEDIAAAAESIDLLRAAVMGFDGCSLRDTASHTLFAEGDPAAEILLIGEVPDADEDRAGHPFAGPAGALLDRMLASIGLSRASILITPLIPWRPPGDRKVNPVEMAACLPFLHRLVVLARPKHLVLMGVRPTRALLGAETSLARLRGRWLPAAIPGAPMPIQALPMRHPGHLLANPLARRDAWHDLLLLHGTLDAVSQRREQPAGKAR